MKYKAYVVSKPAIEEFSSPEYASFLNKTVFEAGITLLVQRHKKRPEYPYMDTKFNPNLGKELPPSAYNVVYPWFLGRGSEACAAHLEIMDDLPSLKKDLNEAREIFSGFLNVQTDAIIATIKKNGRCPFRINRDFTAVDAKGNPISIDTSSRGAGDFFCAKGLIASGVPDKVDAGKKMFDEYIEAALALKYASEQTGEQQELVGQGAFMLAFGAICLLIAHSSDAERPKWVELTARLMDFVLDRHYDPKTGLFSEYVKRTSNERTAYLDPGHATELVGLGLQAVETAKNCGAAVSEIVQRAFARAEKALPLILLKCFKLGHCQKHGGIYKAVDNTTGTPINDDLPWWNLPETMRAAVRAAAVVDDADLKKRLLEIARVCSNEYFAHYPNPGFSLFPFQTRSGKTGQVIDVAPAIPEGDPLYHTNLALLDMLHVARRLAKQRSNH